VKATVEGLQSLKRPSDVAALRGKTVSEVLGLDGAPPEEAAEAEAPAEAPAAVATPGEAAPPE